MRFKFNVKQFELTLNSKLFYQNVNFLNIKDDRDTRFIDYLMNRNELRT